MYYLLIIIYRKNTVMCIIYYKLRCFLSLRWWNNFCEAHPPHYAQTKDLPIISVLLTKEHKQVAIYVRGTRENGVLTGSEGLIKSRSHQPPLLSLCVLLGSSHAECALTHFQRVY